MNTKENNTRNKIIDCAYELIKRESCTNITARKIAKEGGLSLGLISYHFDSVDEIIYLAMKRMIDHAISIFSEKITQHNNQEQRINAILSLIYDLSWNTNENLVLSYELYAISSRNEYFKPLIKYWMDNSHHVLSTAFEPSAAKCIDVLIEGITLHNFFDTNRIPREHAKFLIQSCIAIRS